MELVFRDGTVLRYARLQPALERMYDELAAEVAMLRKTTHALETSSLAERLDGARS